MPIPHLASPLGDLQDHYDVVVVGSGYGGAVAAARIAQTRADGHHPSVCIFERGREYQPGDYPHTLAQTVANFQVHAGKRHVGSRAGLYEFRVFHDVSVFKGCGLGGTSLVNAGVVIRPEPEVLDSPEWPKEIREEGLGTWFDRAHAMLEPEQYPRPLWPVANAPLSPWPDLPKLTALRDAALPGTRAETAEIAVSFRDRINPSGVNLHACKLCGDCVSGCNFGAKKTLITNYLPHARNHGAQIFCGLEVRWIERRYWPDLGRNVWLVHFRKSETHGTTNAPDDMFVATDIVVLSAGALGSTEILLRSRDRGLRMSDQVGEKFTGNGDLIAFAYNTDRLIRGVGRGYRAPERVEGIGPTIAGTIDARLAASGMLIQEGAIPSSLRFLARLVLPLSAFFSGSETQRPLWDVFKRWARGLGSLLAGAYRGAVARTQTFLLIGHDNSEGRMTLVGDRLDIRWPAAGFQAALKEGRAYLQALALRLGGRHVISVFWSRLFGHRLITVHPLGGCVMAEDAAAGVVNHQGQVFDGGAGPSVYESLYVADGSIIPCSLGANPLLLISALSERISHYLIRQHSDRWLLGRSATERPTPARSAVGLAFSERMRGSFRRAGAPETSDFEMFIDITSDDVMELTSSEKHPAVILGNVRASALSSEPLSARGEFNLFTMDPDRVETRLMSYRMFLTARDGMSYYFSGDKVIHDEPGAPNLWGDLTTLRFTLHEVNDGGPVVGAGQVRLKTWDVIRIALSARVTGSRSPRERWSARLRFMAFYATAVYKQIGWPFATADLLDAFKRKPSLPEIPKETDHATVVTHDDADILLTRIQGGSLGPVIVAPGYGTSTYCFRLPTVKKNITQFLSERGYDVWLLDYRASDRSAASVTQFTVDHIARYDWPAAVRHVIEETSPPGTRLRPQVLAHCLGSGSLFMSLLGGWLLDDNGLPLIRSQVSSQMFTHFDQVWFNRLRSMLPTADLMWLIGYWPTPPNIAPHTFDPEVDTRSPFFPKIWDRLLQFYPTKERCRNPVCRKIHLLYGDVFRHDQLNADTHDATYDLWNRTNARIFKQLQHMVARNKVVDAKGHNSYLRPENARHLRLPITLIQGMGNTFFKPAGADITLNWLRRHGAPALPDGVTKDELYQLVRLAGYGHNDTFIGKNAHRDVFPLLQAALEKGDAMARRLAS